MQCKNCHTTIEANQNFCFECGARTIRNRLRPMVLIKQINEQFLSIDNKFLKTFIDLFKNPDQVINGYIDGTRKRYIDVLQYFAIALTLVGIQVFLMDSFFTEELNSSFETLKSLDSNSNSKNNPFNINLESFDDINRYQSVIYVLTIPIYALASWLVNFIIKPNFFYNFTEHMVLNIYYYAQVIIITALLNIIFLCFGLDYLVISGVVSLLIFIYHFYTLKKVFKLDFWNGIAFYLLVMVVFGITGFLIGIFILLLGFFYGFFDAVKK